MSQPRKARGSVTAGPQAALRQAGTSQWHPDACECRKCRRMRKAVAQRVKPKYGQSP